MRSKLIIGVVLVALFIFAAMAISQAPASPESDKVVGLEKRVQALEEKVSSMEKVFTGLVDELALLNVKIAVLEHPSEK